MRIVVCIRQGRNGEASPFDACAYEEALRIPGAEITLLSMGAPSTEGFLMNLTRLGAKNAILLTDSAFAGSDTLATAYILSLAIKKLKPELVLCGRQTLEGDTAQTGVMLSELIGYSLITNVMKMECTDSGIVCKTRSEASVSAEFPVLATVERINTLRLPRLRSKPTNVDIWSAASLNADITRCGLAGSPTRVLSSYENQTGKRKCKFIELSELDSAIIYGLRKQRERSKSEKICDKKLKKVCIVGEAPREAAETISDDITQIPLTDINEIISRIRSGSFSAVLWGSDLVSKRLASLTAARLGLGLCADCTSLETDGSTLFMIRPALSGNVIARIKSLTSPAMATVRTCEPDSPDIIVTAGYGVKDDIDKVKAFAERIGAKLGATRKLVDNGILPYEYQVGLTGKTVSPPVYIAIGVSGAVQHVAGMQSSGTVIAINPDKNAPIFEYSDFGIYNL